MVNFTAVGPAAPPPQDFLRRFDHASAVLGDYLYIEGGEVAQLEEGRTVIHPIDQTISVPLYSSWTTAGVKPNIFQGSFGPIFCNSFFWVDQASEVAYRFGGDECGSNAHFSLPHVQGLNHIVQKLIPDGKGAGNWTILSRPTWLKAPFYAGSSTYGKSFGYYLNGFYFTKNLAPLQPGFISFDFAKEQWQDLVQPSVSRVYGSHINSVFVTNDNTRGFITTFGGSITPPGKPLTSGFDGNWTTNPMNNITIFDPTSNSWLWQIATGEIPSPREDFCAVVAQGSGGISEIFVYGGSSPISSVPMRKSQIDVFGEIYVLSIPAFRWFRVYQGQKYRRYGQTCELVGKRQLLSIGGRSFLTLTSSVDNTKDPFPQGFGLFDMTSLRWTSQFNAEALPYETPRLIKNWYAQKDANSINWSSSAARSLFDFSNMSSNPFDVYADSDGGTRPPYGVIFGSIFGGLGLILLLIFFIFRYKRLQRREYKDSGDTNWGKSELQAISPSDVSEAGKKSALSTSSTKRPQELDATGKYEIEAAERQELGSGGPYELDSPPTHAELSTGRENPLLYEMK